MMSRRKISARVLEQAKPGALNKMDNNFDTPPYNQDPIKDSTLGSSAMRVHPRVNLPQLASV